MTMRLASTLLGGLVSLRSNSGVLLRDAAASGGPTLAFLLRPWEVPTLGDGILLALVHGYGPRPARLLVRAYVELVRGTPLMLQLYFVFFFLPELGIRVPALATAILGLALKVQATGAGGAPVLTLAGVAREQ
jgi:His/Glu/Gln/Arg/opine family amino acid ABC transporter permease subunit